MVLTPADSGVFGVSFFIGNNGEVNKNDSTLFVRVVRNY
jgi:hypothetical protein